METKNSPKIMGIFGTGRSGSSWLGSIMDSHPQVAYRFEPFHRLKHDKAILQARQLLESEQLQERDLVQIYKALLPSHPLLERPPFFPKTDEFVFCKSWVRVPTRQFNILSFLFKWLYTPRTQPPIVFKEVVGEQMMRQLLTSTSVPVVYLVRHPCAVVLSTVTGQKQDMMPTGRYPILSKLLHKHDPALAAQYSSKVEDMDLLEKAALLWRIDVEKGILAAQGHKNALIVIYENLCNDPLGISKQIFEHFGLDFSTQTAHYLDSLNQSTQTQRRYFSEFGIKSYFSVIRNPEAMKDKWKQKMPLEDRQRVLQLVQESPAFQFCASLGKW
jgi:hypothetical protein